MKLQIAEDIPGRISRIGKLRNHTLKSEFNNGYQARHQKGRKVPINITEKIKQDLETRSHSIEDVLRNTIRDQTKAFFTDRHNNTDGRLY